MADTNSDKGVPLLYVAIVLLELNLGGTTWVI
jgi:hypothetical protein